jgi:phenylalanine-4-hydroxylase
MSRNRVKPIEQIYDHYTNEDFSVWKLLYETQINSLDGIVAEEFLKGLEILDFNSQKIPDFKKINEKLDIINGWGIKTVPNIAQPKEFFKYLANKKFTSTCWLRSMEEIDYLEEPDMFHDVFAHVPMLTDVDYTNFFQNIGQLALEVINDEERLKKLQRLYWFTIEFGLMETSNGNKIYGAGIISSKNEMKNAFSNKSIKTDFNVLEIMNQDFRIDIVQEKYFVIKSFNQLSGSLEDVRHELFKN